MRVGSANFPGHFWMPSRPVDHPQPIGQGAHDVSSDCDIPEVVELCLSDNHNAWDLESEGVWRRRAVPGPDELVNAQEILMRRHAAGASDG